MLQHSFALQCSRSRRYPTVVASLSHASSTFGEVSGPSKHKMCMNCRGMGPSQQLALRNIAGDRTIK